METHIRLHNYHAVKRKQVLLSEIRHWLSWQRAPKHNSETNVLVLGRTQCILHCADSRRQEGSFDL